MISKKDIIPFIDLTSLNAVDSASSIQKLIETANGGYQHTFPASVCVYPKFADQIKQSVQSPIKTCVVSTYFPSSQAPLSLKLNEIAYLNTVNVDEIDIVLPIGDFLAGDHQSVFNELNTIRSNTNKTIKLIIETGLLQQLDLIEKATKMGIDSGMDFIKTSTGKAEKGADFESVKIMAQTIKKSEKTVGLKVAGGVRTYTEAKAYIQICSTILGADFINPKTFRIGASSLYNDLISDS